MIAATTFLRRCRLPRRAMPLLALLLTLVLCAAAPAAPKRVRTKLATPPPAEEEFVAGTFMVSSNCSTCNNGYRLDQIRLFGFDKPAASLSEVIFLTNSTDRTLKGISLYVSYLNMEGALLHKRFLRVSCDVPPGETRRLEFPSWDRQRSFYYHGSAPAGKTRGRRAQPFDVQLDPVSYTLSFADEAKTDTTSVASGRQPTENY